MFAQRRSFFFTLLIGAFFASAPVYAQTIQALSKTNAPPKSATDNVVVLNADRMAYDTDLDIATARGNVQLIQGPKILEADAISYNQGTDQVIASGNVKIKDEGGNVFFGDYLELRDQMDTGFIDQVRGLLLGDARVAGQTGSRREGRYTDLYHGVYSPCVLCAEDPSKPPIWQLTAQRMVHDSDEQQLTYYNATMELGGIPVLYTPYLSNPDPTVKQRSGFLAPEVGFRSNLGALARSFYYFGLSPDQDATLETTYASQQGPLLGGEYRQRFESGKLILSGSIAEGQSQSAFQTNPDTDQKTVRGHIFGTSRFDLNDNWRTGFDIARTTDKNFIRNYGYSNRDILDNVGFVEGFFDRNYASVMASNAQDLRTPTTNQPIAFPYSQYQAFGEEAGTLGGRWSFNAGTLGIARSAGQEDSRLSADTGWQRTIIADGFSHTFNAHLIGNGYVTGNQLRTGPAIDVDNGGTFSGRLIPQFQLLSKYPLINPMNNGNIMIEPIASVAYSAPFANNTKIPNEDSQDLELDATNLFDASRYPGLDRVEQGAHAAYGLKSGYFSNDSSYTTVFFGQSQRLSGRQIFPQGSGLEHNSSDYVGEIEAYPGRIVNLNYRTRLDEKTFASKMHQGTASFNFQDWGVGLSYLFLTSVPGIAQGQNRNNATLSAYTKLAQYWTISSSAIARLGNAARLQIVTTSLNYQDDCLTFQLVGQQNLTNPIGGLHGTTLFFRIGFKTLGFFQSPNIAGAAASE